jgi:hypothetical protein
MSTYTVLSFPESAVTRCRCGRLCAADQLSGCMTCEATYCKHCPSWECDCDRMARAIVERGLAHLEVTQ